MTYVNVPFLKALMEALSYIKFLRDLLSKKGKLEEATMVRVGEACKILAVSSFFAPQGPADERALCD